MPGLVNGRLAPPPPTPNCVSSQADPSDRVHHVAPLQLHGDPATAQERLKSVVLAMPRTRLLNEAPGYLHVAFTTRLFGWVDDVELLLAPDERVVHVRSASRVGSHDLWENRRRVARLRSAWRRAG